MAGSDKLPSWWNDPLYVRPPEDRSKTLKVIGAGLPRSGTGTLTKALRYLLEAEVCHVGSVCFFGPKSFANGWATVLDPPRNMSQDEQDNITRDLLAGYVAVTDAPCCFLVEELCRLYPEAIVICGTRDPQAWWASYKALFFHLNNPFRLILRAVLPSEGPRLIWRFKMAWTKRLRKLHPGRIVEPSGPAFMERHIEYVKRVTPPGRLFFLDVKDGWEPLCKILDKPVPDIPFPRSHTRESIKKGSRAEWSRCVKVMLGLEKAAAAR